MRTIDVPYLYHRSSEEIQNPRFTISEWFRVDTDDAPTDPDESRDHHCGARRRYGNIHERDLEEVAGRRSSHCF